MKEFIDELSSQISYEKQIMKDKTRDLNIWTKEYHQGYIHGLQQALDMAKQFK
jgi:LPS O-antigen subunit length determinant protein (WzzB/FepE family)